MKKNIKLLDNATNTSSAPSNPSYSYRKLNENTDVTSRKPLATETHSKTIFALNNKPPVIIQNGSASNPYSKYMLISNVSSDGDAQSFETPRKHLQFHCTIGPKFVGLL